MSGINKYDYKDRRRQRRLREKAERENKDRKRKVIYVNGDHEPDNFFEEVYYDEEE